MKRIARKQQSPSESESESDMYSATINEDYYAEAGVVSKGVSASCN